jgi:hypothetical protein
VTMEPVIGATGEPTSEPLLDGRGRNSRGGGNFSKAGYCRQRLRLRGSWRERERFRLDKIERQQ